ncbi:MAG: hypothetical protein H0W61_10480 [Bacteroidetes bacterium]|nr:hypothetical protein [Bacteroidota bacterium]
MSEIKIIRKEVKGIVKISSNSQYNNIQAQEVHIAEGITARLYGTVHSAVYLKKGSALYLHGSLKGEIINEGGMISIF